MGYGLQAERLNASALKKHQIISDEVLLFLRNADFQGCTRQSILGPRKLSQRKALYITSQSCCTWLYIYGPKGIISEEGFVHNQSYCTWCDFQQQMSMPFITCTDFMVVNGRHFAGLLFWYFDSAHHCLARVRSGYQLCHSLFKLNLQMHRFGQNAPCLSVHLGGRYCRYLHSPS